MCLYLTLTKLLYLGVPGTKICSNLKYFANEDVRNIKLQDSNKKTKLQ